jgi:peptidoglycan/LPS O-acetylase OafA/YrhL
MATNPIYALIAIFLALTTMWVISVKYGTPSAQGRYASIDGLRGYLAFFVFLHHSSAWYFYTRTGIWQLPPSNLFVHFGQSSVAFFFMITGFLFYGKILDSRHKKIDWARLYVSRLLRLFPLYLFSIILLLLIVAYVSKFVLHESLASLMTQMTTWLLFSIFGTPDVNGVAVTKLINAGVTWSLAYEWFFYFSLPILALFVKNIPSARYLVLSVVGVTVIAMNQPVLGAKAFLTGIAAAYFVRNVTFKVFAESSLATLVVIISLILAVVCSPTAYGALPLALLSVAFVLIACGNSLFGLLIHPISRAFGELSYSIYLLHGVLLYVVFKLALATTANSLSVVQYWMLIFGITPLLILISTITFQWIEKPAMNSTDKVMHWFK